MSVSMRKEVFCRVSDPTGITTTNVVVARSSVVERPADNRKVVGSNPTGPT